MRWNKSPGMSFNIEGEREREGLRLSFPLISVEGE